MKTIKIVSVIITILLFTNCSLEKRHYMSGYNINWNKKYSSEDSKKNTWVNQTNSELIETEEYPLTALNEKNITPSSKINNKSTFFTADSCDVIELKNNTKIQAKVLEINQSSVKYKNCDSLDGSIRVVLKSEIAAITYSNGVKESAENLRYTEPKTEKPAEELKIETKRSPIQIDHPLASHTIIAGGCSFIPVVGWIFGLLSIVFGLISLHNIKKYPEHYKGKKKVLTGLWLGVAGLLAGIIIVIVIFISVGAI